MNNKNHQGRIAAILVAAGNGSRSGLEQPKQYACIAGRAVLAHAYAALAGHPAIGRIIVVIGADQEAVARGALQPVTDAPIFVTGGATRRDSVRAALDYLEQTGEGTDNAMVLVHDAARPFLPSAVLDRLITAMEQYDGAMPVLPIADTLVRGGASGAPLLMGDAVARDALYRVQTPQIFRFAALMHAHRILPTNAPATDDAGMLRAINVDVALTDGDMMLDKLTYPADFARAEMLFAPPRLPRTGMGYDVHRLVAGKPLWLCGIEVPHSHGLSGHSDADVAIHALVDALLGTLAEGDIGSHFPPSDPQWKGAASHQFLAFARDRVLARGGEITHVDVSIICEAPKIGPHRDAMQARLAEILSVTPDRVSVKATTTERLGFAGRKEGIAAQAVATVMLPA